MQDTAKRCQDPNREKRARDLILFLHILAYVLSISLSMAFHFFLPVGIAILAANVLAAVIGSAQEGGRKARAILEASALFLLTGLLTRRYSVKMLCALLVTAASLLNLLADLFGSGADGQRRKPGRISLAFLVLSLCTALLLGYNAAYPDTLSLLTQGDDEEYPENVQETLEERDGMKIFRDVTYESAYANNTYTVYALEESQGVFFYIHGGGFVKGDKEADFQNTYLFSMLEAGYSVVTVDYVLAPQTPFPQALYEVNDALGDFIRHAGDYGLSAKRIIVGGDSAGGMLSGLLAVLNTNPEYAAQLNTVPAVSGTGITLKGYISISGLVDVPRMGDTGVFTVDWMFDTWGRTAFQMADYAQSELGRTGSVLDNVTGDFPAAYISDGNFGTFDAQGKELVEKLEALGVPVEGNFPGWETAILPHVWELNTANDTAAQNFKKTVWFMDRFMR